MKPEHVSRLAKAFVDNGAAHDLAEGAELLASSELQIYLGPEVAMSETLQLAALVATETGRRAFPAGVRLVADSDCLSVVPHAPGHLLEQLAGVTEVCVAEYDRSIPTIAIGGDPSDQPRSGVRAAPRGWAGGAVPFNWPSPEFQPGTLGGILAGAIAVSQVFLEVHGMEASAGILPTGISAWDPSIDWENAEAIGPTVEYVPNSIWLVGLGHLGQAMAWVLQSLPHLSPDTVRVTLQDYDRVSIENLGTSLFASETDLGVPKTTVVSHALERYGFRTAIQQRRYHADQKVLSEEPRLALAGLDSPEARHELSKVGWDLLFDCGLGAGAEDFTRIVWQQLTEDRRSEDAFSAGSAVRDSDRLLDVPSYARRLAAGEDRCGVIQDANQSVATAFVGVTAAAVNFGQILRPLHGSASSRLVNMDLRDLGSAMVDSGEIHNLGIAECGRARPLYELRFR